MPFQTVRTFLNAHVTPYIISSRICNPHTENHSSAIASLISELTDRTIILLERSNTTMLNMPRTESVGAMKLPKYNINSDYQYQTRGIMSTLFTFTCNVHVTYT